MSEYKKIPDANYARRPSTGYTAYPGAGYSKVPAANYAARPTGTVITSPSQLSNLLSWHRADLGITLGATPRAAGTTPPAVTFTGTLTQATAIWLDFPIGGARGVAQFRYSLDGGATYSSNTLTAATVDLTPSGVTANFPVGTYNVDNTYKATVATWSDQFDSRNVTQATANLQFRMVHSNANLNNQKTVACDAVSGILSGASNQTVKELIAVTTHPLTTFPTFSVLFAAIGGASHRGDSGTANWRTADFVGTRYRDEVATATALSAANDKHFYRQVVTTPVASTGYRVGGDGGASREFGGEIAELLTLSAAVDPTELSQLIANYINPRYGFAL